MDSNETEDSNIENKLEQIKTLESLLHLKVPNPAPLGLFSFGLTTALFQMKHSRLAGVERSDMHSAEKFAWGFAIFYGGLLQFVAGLGEIRRNNVFEYTAFLSYGGFWLSYGTSEILINVFSADTSDVNPRAEQAMFILMGIFTLVLWICTFNINITVCVLMFSLMATFFLLAVGKTFVIVDYIAGCMGIFTSAVAYWLGTVELVNDIYGGDREIIPLGQFKKRNFTHFFPPAQTQRISRETLLAT
mmetsp:Transcript_7411/g.10601  ORF Transcript_7411/g.10601 Transcript_7411/m.10601 type:complete len:246 (+) Transcript_7411:1617-2354(+)